MADYREEFFSKASLLFDMLLNNLILLLSLMLSMRKDPKRKSDTVHSESVRLIILIELNFS